MSHETEQHVLDRLRRVTRIAQQYGFEIRGESLDGAGCTWCELRGRRILFVDLSQPAAEQIIAIREILESTAKIRPLAGVAVGSGAAL